MHSQYALFPLDELDFRATFDNDIISKDPGTINLAFPSLQADQILFVTCTKVDSLLLCRNLACKDPFFSLASAGTEGNAVEFC